MTDLRVESLRANQTEPELLLWAQLRKKRTGDLRFRRQFRIGHYIVDFVCLPAHLIVEVDGPSHEMTFEADEHRTRWLEQQNFRVLRFWNDDVRRNLEGVIRTIEAELAARPLPLAPSRKGRGVHRWAFVDETNRSDTPRKGA